MATAKSKAPSNFEQTLHLLGVHPSEVDKGATVRRAVTINTLEDYKKVFAGSVTPQSASAHHKSLKANHAAALSGNDPAHLLTRLSAHLYGGQDLSPADRAGATKFFPLKVQLVAGEDLVIDTPHVYGPSASPVTMVYRSVTFKDAGSITTQNTILSFTADSVTVGNLSGGTPYLINILGVKGASGTSGTDGTSYPNQAAKGTNASTPTAGICTGATPPQMGTPGQTGGDALTNGGPGHDGKPSLQANITINDSLTGQLTVYTRSGDGGDGGRGGNGGNGQQGGDGGNGCNTGCECTDGANGANGGNGGKGSNGGNGGNGINGNDIFVRVPSANASQVVTGKDSATPGKAGAAGGPGSAGKPGSGGTTGHKHCSDGRPGSQGGSGFPGKEGADGTQNGAPGNIHIN